MDRTMIYDYGIIGAGIAGAICAYELSKKGYRCILFEKEEQVSDKICGGGVSYKALSLLDSIGIESKYLVSEDIKVITGHRIYKDGEIFEKVYTDKISLGTQRVIFDNFLRDRAIMEGADIRYNTKVYNPKFKNQAYCIDGIEVRKIVWATGAKNPEGRSIRGQSIGISGQISAQSSLENNLFHYWYYQDGNDKKYFWAFPIGKKLWNVGVWSRMPDSGLKAEYITCVEHYFLNTVEGEWGYYRKPRAAFLGHIDQTHKGTVVENGVGDFAGKCNVTNGGGIIYAIESAIMFAATQ